MEPILDPGDVLDRVGRSLKTAAPLALTRGVIFGGGPCWDVKANQNELNH